MKHLQFIVLTGAVLGTLIVACSPANFGGNTGAATTASADGSGTGSNGGGTDGSGTSGSGTIGGIGTSTSPTPGSISSTGNNTSPGSISTSASTCGNGQAGIDWTGDEKSCIVDQGKTWDFDKNACVAMAKATFTCNWTTFLAQLSAKNINDPNLLADYKAGALLISCGQSQDGNRIAVQWIKATDGAGAVACTNGTVGSHHVTTGCYTYYPNNPNPPAVPTDPTALAAYVYGCVNQL